MRAAPELTVVTDSTADIIATPVLECMADVEPRSVEWLWPYRLAVGKLNLIMGDPDLGKSFLTLDIASRVSMGRPWPDDLRGRNPAGNVIVLSCEDDPGDTIRPRLDACSADVNCIHLMRGVNLYDPETRRNTLKQFNMEVDLPTLESALDSIGGVRLVIIDPIGAYCGNVNSHKDAEVRGMLGPLADLAARRSVAVLAVCHMNKSGGQHAMYRLTGSLAFMAAARCVWLACKDRDDPAKRLLLKVKNNLAPADIGGLAFRITTEIGQEIPCVFWEAEQVTTTANDALGEPEGESAGLTEAKQWLLGMLSKCPVAAVELKKLAAGDGISVRMLDKAKDALKVIAEPNGFGAKWSWRLPRQSSTPAPDTVKLL